MPNLLVRHIDFYFSIIFRTRYHAKMTVKIFTHVNHSAFTNGYVNHCRGSIAIVCVGCLFGSTPADG